MPSIDALKLGDIMSSKVMAVRPEYSVSKAAALMGEARVSCLVVVDGRKPLGILTEKDLLGLINRHKNGKLAVSDVMSASVIAAPADTDFRSAYALLRRHGIRHLVVANAAGELIGVATATDFRTHLSQEVFRKIDHLHAVLDPIVSELPTEATLAQAVKHMLAAAWDYVLVMEKRIPVGIITERDIPRFWSSDLDPQTVMLSQVMTHPLHCIPISMQVAEASAAMARLRVRHLPVVDEAGQLLGVVSQNRMLEKLGLALFDEVWRDHIDLQEQKSQLETRLGLILEATGFGVWEYHYQADRFIWSPSLATLCGRPEGWAPAGLTGWLELLHPQDRSKALDDFHGAQTPGDPLFQSEYRIQGAAGQWRWMQARGRVLQRDEQNRPLCTAGNLLDISERKSAEVSLEAQRRFMEVLLAKPDREALLRAALDFALDLPDLDSGIIFRPGQKSGYEPLAMRGFSDEFAGAWVEVTCLFPSERLSRGKIYCSCTIHDSLCPIAATPTSECGRNTLVDEVFRERDGALAAVLLPLGIEGDNEWEGCLFLACRHAPRISTATSKSLQTLADLYHQASLRLRTQEEVARQNELVRLEKRFSEELINALPGSFYMCDARGRLLRWNRLVANLTGYSEAELSALNGTDLYQEEDRPQVRAAIADAFAFGSATVEAGLRSHDGEVIPFLVTGRRTEIDGKNYLLALGLDISETKLVRRTLDEEKLRLRSLLNTIPDPVWLKDPNGVFLFCNPSVERLLAAPEADIIGRTDYDFVPLMADAFREQDRAAAAAGVSLTNEEWLTSATDGYRGLYETIKTPLLNGGGELVGVLGIARDITERRNTEETLRRAAGVFHNTQEGIVITDTHNNIIDINPAFTQITGFSREEVIGKNPKILSSGIQKADFYRTMWQTVLETGNWRGEVCNRRKSGELYTEMLSIAAVRDETGNILEFIGVFSDISRLKEHAAELDRIAHYDTLTGLPNRRLLADRLGQAIARARRSGRLLAVCYLDLDGFKPVNDRFGHDAGDQLLVTLTRHLQEVLRAEDTLARLGGDEFVLLLNDLAKEQECCQMLERVLATLSRPLPLANKHVINLSASIGVTLYPHDNADGDTLLRHADQAMYQAKECGRNRYHLFDPEYDRQVRVQREFLQQVLRGLRENEFVLYYQPKVNLVCGDVVGMEALIRWRHPVRGLLAPDAFLPMLSGTAVDGQLGEWVIDAALSQLVRWRSEGLDLAVSANISADHLLSPDFAHRLRAALQRHPEVCEGSLELEILESVAISDLEQASHALQAGLNMGVRFALDDFGTGYSSLTYFRRLPVDTLKVDGSFVRDMLDDPDDLGIVESVVRLAGAFNRQVIAEGVETPQHGNVLVRLGCKLGQGYGIAPPMPAGEIPGWIENWYITRPWQHLGASAVPSEDTALLLAMVSHRQWSERVASYIAHPVGPMPSLDSHACRLGQWYNRGGHRRYGQVAQFRDLETVHERFHDLANELLELAEERSAMAQKRLPELLSLRDVLLENLERFIAHVQTS